MSCPHSLKPGPCSQCLGVVPQRVEQVGDRILVDGVDRRGLDPVQPFSNRTSYGRKGGLAHGRRPKP